MLSRSLKSVYRSSFINCRTCLVPRIAASSMNTAATDTSLTGKPEIKPSSLFDPNDRRLPTYVKDYTNMELFSFIAVSLVTSNKPILKLAIKIMPFLPNWAIKSFVSPLFCGGETYREVQTTGSKLLSRGIGNMFLSYSVEDAEGAHVDAKLLDSAVPTICGSIDQVLVKMYDESCSDALKGKVRPTTGFVALKPTGLMQGAAKILEHYGDPAYKDQWDKYVEVCRSICQYAADKGQGKAIITFDAEKDSLQAGIYAIQRAMMQEFNREDRLLVMGTIQMYRQDSLDKLKEDISHAKEHGYKVAFKLVRGAYLHSEPDRWNLIHKTQQDTNISYDKGVSICLDHIITEKHDSPVGKLVVASHNDHSSAIALARIQAASSDDKEIFEKVVFAQLLGMCEDQTRVLSKSGASVVSFVPWGPVKETKEYLVRRLEENGDAVRPGGWSHVKYGIQEGWRRIVGGK